MLFDDLLNNPAKWMVESRDEHDIVLTSRIRLARNLTATFSRLGHAPAEGGNAEAHLR